MAEYHVGCGSFAIAEELYDIERMLTDGRKELLTDTDAESGGNK